MWGILTRKKKEYTEERMEATFWAIVPTILAIAVSLITKEVNLSLLFGIIVGGLIHCKFNIFTAVSTILDVLGAKVYGNMNVLIFIILLGVIVHLMNMSGASHKYAQWAGQKLKTKKQTLLATMLLGVIIFIDDYFNCLTVGTVMQPICDEKKISREKLAYIIDSTAAPVCIMAPISSWAVAVSSSVPEQSSIDGFLLFIKSIFCNYYSWLSLLMVLLTTILAVDFGKMKKCEYAADMGKYQYENIDQQMEGKEIPENGRVSDLLLPVIVLIILSITCMLYTGGFFAGKASAISAISNCDAATSLAMAAFYAILFIGVLYLPRKIMTGKQYLDGLVEGFKNMVPTVLILTFAWTLSGICGSDYLDAGGFIARTVVEYQIPLSLMPAIFFVIAIFLALSTGTSWGTFAILLPITISVFQNQVSPSMVLTISAVLGGSVCGDHVSPISDTTILSSTGAGCHHISHVETQLQYGIVVAAVSFLSYVVCGFMGTQLPGMPIGIVGIVGFLFIMKKRNHTQERGA